MLSENMKRELRILYLTEITRACDFSCKETCLALGSSTAQAASEHEDKAAEWRAYADYLRLCVDELDATTGKSSYQQALEKARQANNACVAELFAESCLEGEDPHVTDDSGRPLTREEVYQKLLNGDLN